MPMPKIEWVGAWAVDGDEKLCRLPDGDVLRDHATTAEIEMYGALQALRERIATQAHRWESHDTGVSLMLRDLVKGTV